MDVRYINPFVKSVSNTFETMCGLAVTVGKAQLKIGDDPRTDVSAIVGLSGDAAGSVVLHFTFESASKVASAFAGTEITPKHPDFADALGELANMVTGGAKCQFEGLSISISLPSVVVGHNHNVSASKSSPRIVIPCTTTAGIFYIEVGMVLAKPAAVRGARAAAPAGATA
jgi:chemotaxis protein CheX